MRTAKHPTYPNCKALISPGVSTLLQKSHTFFTTCKWMCVCVREREREKRYRVQFGHQQAAKHIVHGHIRMGAPSQQKFSIMRCAGLWIAFCSGR